MTVADIISVLLLAAGLFFFTAGTVGLVRLPDLYSRLHALTKADVLGLGLTVLAMLPHALGWAEVFKLLLTWVLVSVSGATVCYLIADRARRQNAQVQEVPRQ